jgi:hypothetical protein
MLYEKVIANFYTFFMKKLTFPPFEVHTKIYRQIQKNGKQGSVVQYLIRLSEA